MDTRVRILYVYDPDIPPGVTPGNLTRADDALLVDTAHGAGDALDRLSTATYDCVLSTHALPDDDGVTLLRHIREFDPDLPFVLYTHGGSEQIASEAVSAGVSEYVPDDPDANQTGPIASVITDLASDAVDGSEAKIRELAEATDDVLWLISADWEDLLFVNSAYSRIWGQSETRLRADPTSFLDAVHPEDRSHAEKAVERLTRGESVEIELRVNSDENYERRVLIQAEPIFDRDGTVKRIAGASRDVTEQRAGQRRLEEEKRTVDSIFSALPDVLYTFDTRGYLLRWNEQLNTETGYTDDEIEEMYVTDFVPAEEMETIANSFQEIIEDRRSVTVESAFERKDGERVPFEFTGAPLEDADGDLRGVTGVGRNVSDRKKRQRRFEAVFDNTYQFTGLMAPDGTLLEVNQAAVEFAGQDREELVGTKIWEAYWFQANETATRTAKHAVETAGRGEFFRDQITVQGADREAVIDFSARPVTDENGDVELVIPEGRDITRLSERERQLRVTNRFLRHNIRNKLTTIQGHAKLVSEANDRQARSSGAAIFQSASELHDSAEMARDIHDLIETDPTPEPFDLIRQLDRAVELVHDRHSEANVLIDGPESLEAMTLRSMDEALAELLGIVLESAETERETVRVEIAETDSVVVKIATPGDGPSATQQDVLTGDLDVEQVRHAQGLGVWYAYWNVRYSGGEITVTEATDIRVHLPTA
jgi:PAS domain S-box-containing protein